MLALVEEATTAVLTLAEGLDPEELLRSRLARGEVRRQLLAIASALSHVGPEGRSAWPELEWDSWSTAATQIGSGGPKGDEALWFAVSVLTPATLSWLRLYRSRARELERDEAE